MTPDEALDHLYGVDLDAFVSERTRLARGLREGGDREGAQRLAKARKPTVAAWALNQLARRQRRDVDLLLDAGHRLRQAQEGIVRGADRDTFEQARKTEREALHRLTQQASELLGGASAQTLAQIGATLRTAAVSEEGRELLARGRFTTPLESEGFDVFGAPPPPSRGKAPVKKSTVPGPGPRTLSRDQVPAAKRQAKEELRKARERLRGLERTVRDAERRTAKLESEWKASKRAAESARAQLAAAERELKQAQRRAR